MRLFVCTDHDYVWPVGVASVVVAANEMNARELLDEQLIAQRLKPWRYKPYGLVEVDLSKESATILCNGDY